MVLKNGKKRLCVFFNVLLKTNTPRSDKKVKRNQVGSTEKYS